jgi:hypothetical protein
MTETTKKTKRQKFKSWCADNRENLAVAGVGSFFVAAYGYVFYASVKEANQAVAQAHQEHVAYLQWRDETNTWLNDQRNAGNAVYQLEDGRFLTVAADAPQETVIR